MHAIAISHAQEYCKKYPQLNNHKCLSLAQKRKLFKQKMSKVV